MASAHDIIGYKAEGISVRGVFCLKKCNAHFLDFFNHVENAGMPTSSPPTKKRNNTSTAILIAQIQTFAPSDY